MQDNYSQLCDAEAAGVLAVYDYVALAVPWLTCITSEDEFWGIEAQAADVYIYEMLGFYFYFILFLYLNILYIWLIVFNYFVILYLNIWYILLFVFILFYLIIYMFYIFYVFI